MTELAEINIWQEPEGGEVVEAEALFTEEEAEAHTTKIINKLNQVGDRWQEALLLVKIAYDRGAHTALGLDWRQYVDTKFKGALARLGSAHEEVAVYELTEKGMPQRDVAILISKDQKSVSNIRKRALAKVKPTEESSSVKPKAPAKVASNDGIERPKIKQSTDAIARRRDHVRTLYLEGHGSRVISKALGVGRTTVEDDLRTLELAGTRLRSGNSTEEITATYLWRDGETDQPPPDDLVSSPKNLNKTGWCDLPEASFVIASIQKAADEIEEGVEALTQTERYTPLSKRDRTKLIKTLETAIAITETSISVMQTGLETLRSSNEGNEGKES